MNFESRTRKKTLVYLEDKVERNGIAVSHRLGAEDHGVDVAEDFVRGDVRGRLIQLPDDLRMEEPSGSHLETFDAR